MAAVRFGGSSSAGCLKFAVGRTTGAMVSAPAVIVSHVIVIRNTVAAMVVRYELRQSTAPGCGYCASHRHFHHY